MYIHQIDLVNYKNTFKNRDLETITLLHVATVMQSVNNNQSRAAKILRISRGTLRSKIRLFHERLTLIEEQKEKFSISRHL